MKPASFDYYRPDNVKEALATLRKLGHEAKILAGGQSLVPMLNMRLLKPTSLIDISGLKDAKAITLLDDCIEVGAAVTQTQLQNYLQTSSACQLLQSALPWTGHWQTRQRGTVIGSIVHSDPTSELSLCLKHMGGEVVLSQQSGRRTVGVENFQIGLLETDVQEGEMATAIRFPLGDRQSRFGFREVSQRHGDFAIVALAVELSETEIRVGVGGVTDVPVVKSFPSIEGADLDDALNELAWELRGSDDVHATARYRRELVRRLGKSLIEQVRTL